ncbi:cytochrome C oxidase subunit IV family protein [Marinobacteraceae bacterium S3BR75-40.1]
MLKTYLTLLVCTALPVLGWQLGWNTQGLLLLVLALVLIKAFLLVDRFMELRQAPRVWRWAVQLWAPVVVGVLAGIQLF